MNIKDINTRMKPIILIDRSLDFFNNKVLFPEKLAKALLRNKLDKAGEVILYDNEAKNTGIAIATARLFNEVSVQKNKPEWSSYFVTMPKANEMLKNIGLPKMHKSTVADVHKELPK